ncbi:MAG: serpin family protein [Phycisphaerae bacterium]|nr:serpin family protein [Phycisphaerae bacterium]
MNECKLAIVLGVCLILGACQPHHSDANESQVDKKLPSGAASVSAQDLKILTGNNNQFAMDLYAQLKNNPGNMFFSPYSISTALAMTYAGSRNNTEKEMGQTLRFTLSQDRLPAAFSAQQAWLKAIEKKGDVELSVANALWPHVTYKFLPNFIELNRRYYGVDITNVDYVTATEAARTTINDWVDRKTAGKIKDLIGPNILDPLTRLVLTNAIYFKGFWAEQFKKEATRPMAFHVSPTEKKDVPTMFQKSTFRYKAGQDVQVLELPYKGKDLSMIVLLPQNVDGLEAMEKALTAGQLSAWTADLQDMELNVYLPKFTMTSKFSLSDALKAMGMKDAFSMAADFSGMDGTTDLLITAVLHKAFVAVDEEGTEAAAATAVVIGLKSMPMLEEFRADHPFLFLIRENETGSILFLGRVKDPS